MKDYTIHGTELEPFHIYHQIYEHGGLQVPFHWHKEMEWIWVEKGSLELTLGTQRKILQKQDFVMINSYELHQLRSIGNTSSIHHALVFLPNMLAFSYPDHCQISYIEPLLSRQLLLPSFLPKNLSCISSVRSIFQELLVLYDTRPSGWQLLLKNNLYHILVILFSENLLQPSPANRSLQTRENQYKQILRYIQEHYDRKIYLEDLASSLDMNPQYFCRFFKKQFQMTPMTYINYYRTLQAADLLRHSLSLFWKSVFAQVLKIPAILQKRFENIITAHRQNTENFQHFKKATGAKPVAFFTFGHKIFNFLS